MKVANDSPFAPDEGVMTQFHLKAIAFKLDEISTLLKQQRSPMMNLAQSYAKKSAKPDAQVP